MEIQHFIWFLVMISSSTSSADPVTGNSQYSCPHLPYPTFIYQEYCYMYVNDYTNLDWYTWASADKYCKKHNMNLTSIHSVEESNFLTSHMKNYNHYWIGLTRLSRIDGRYEMTNQFAWTDGSILDYTKWVGGIPPGPPSISDDPYYDLEEAHCLALSPGGYFVLEKCFDWVRPWICKVPAVICRASSKSRGHSQQQQTEELLCLMDRTNTENAIVGVVYNGKGLPGYRKEHSLLKMRNFCLGLVGISVSGQKKKN